jgi:hypothetical protein
MRTMFKAIQGDLQSIQNITLYMTEEDDHSSEKEVDERLKNRAPKAVRPRKVPSESS